MATLGALGSTPATPPAAARVPVDHDHLSRYTFGNRELELEVLNLFAAQAPEYVGGLRDARTGKEWRDAAHSLKGSARAVGAHFVAELAQRAELQGLPTDPGARAVTIDALAEAISEAKAHIAMLENES
jgi:HPt (histidine-containing phosphotransfer) domain-containing protein